MSDYRIVTKIISESNEHIAEVIYCSADQSTAIYIANGLQVLWESNNIKHISSKPESRFIETEVSEKNNCLDDWMCVHTVNNL